MKKIIFFITFFSFALIADTLPELGSSFDHLISSSEQKKIKFQIMSQVFSSNQVINDPEINDYLNNLGNELISKGTITKPEINFFLINDNTINAFAMLGNVIGVHTGLIFSANTESELASVLSHEIAHITQKHLLRLFDSQSRNSYKTFIAMAFALLIARSNPQLAQGAIIAGSASQVQNTLDYTRDNEREADRFGLEILNKSGFDPKGFIDFFSTMQKFNNFSSGPAPAFLRTHPVTTERITDIEDRLKDFEYIQKKNSLEFFLVKSKLQVLVGEYSELSVLFQHQLDTKNYINEAAIYFGLVYAFIKENKINQARKYFEKLKNFNYESPMILELNANLLVKEQKFDEAYEIYKKGLNHFPYHRAFVIGISKLLLRANRPNELIQLIKSYLDIFKNDPYLYQILSKAYHLNGNKLLEHESLSDSYFYQYNLKEAISQMDMAARVNSDNFQDQSRVEYRLKFLKKELELLSD